MARMERESGRVQRDLKTVESRYGEDARQLVIASGDQRDPGGLAPADPRAPRGAKQADAP
jgi:hypothetical protein